MGVSTNFPDGIDIAGAPVIPGGGDLPLTGQYWYVSSTTGSDSFPGSWDQPFATLDFAIGRCTANKGDTIVLKQGHAESVASASAITVDVAGINIVGLGIGADRPEFTFGTATTASIVVSAANVSISNIVGIAAIDALTNPFHIQAANCSLNVEWQDGSAAVEAARAVLTTAAADKLNVKLKYIGFPAGNACVNAVRLVGGNDVSIFIDFYGLASTAVVEFITTACTNVNVRGYMYNSGTTNFSKSVVDTVTGSTWFAAFYDGAAASFASGGSGGAIAADDVATVNTNVTTLMASTERTIVKTDGAVLNGDDDLFVVAGGPIMITNFVGRVTTVIGGAANMTIQEAVTTPAGDVAFSTTVAIDADAAGTTYTFTAAAPGVLTPTTAGALANVPTTKWLAVPGTIQALGSAAQSGVIEWSMSYLPLSPNATVTVAA